MIGTLFMLVLSTYQGSKIDIRQWGYFNDPVACADSGRVLVRNAAVSGKLGTAACFALPRLK